MNDEENKEKEQEKKDGSNEEKKHAQQSSKDDVGEEKKEEEKDEQQPTSDEKKEENTEKPVEAPKPEAKAEEVKEKKKEKPKPEPTGKFKELIKDIESLSIIELSELVKTLEDRFGVSAAAPVAVAQAPTGKADADTDEGKSTFNIEFTASGEKKIDAIKAVREVNQDLGLKEAKDLVDGAPKMLKENVKKEEAEEIKKKIEASGAKVTLK